MGDGAQDRGVTLGRRWVHVDDDAACVVLIDAHPHVTDA
jgi:hypothetical protein